MKLSDWVGLGDKIQIRLVYQLEQKLNGKDVEVIDYKSRVYDIFSDVVLEIMAPQNHGKTILFKEGLRCEMVFYTKKGLFSSYAVVRKRYIRDELYVLKMEIKSSLVKYQRREFFRVPCRIDFDLYKINGDIASCNSTNELYEAISGEFNETKEQGKMCDLSAGGIKFETKVQYETDDYLAAAISLENDKMKDSFLLVCQIINSEKSDSSEGKFISRGVFIFKDLRDREKIVAYVFEAERALRKKKLGD